MQSEHLSGFAWKLRFSQEDAAAVNELEHSLSHFGRLSEGTSLRWAFSVVQEAGEVVVRVHACTRMEIQMCR